MPAVSHAGRELRLPSPQSRELRPPPPQSSLVNAPATIHPVHPQAPNLPHIFIAEPLAPRATSEVVPQAVTARDTLVAVLKGKDTKQDALDLRKAIAQLLELSPQLGRDKVDQVLCGFLNEAVQGNRRALLDAWVEAIAGAPADLVDPHRKLALLKGAALPVSPHLWSATQAAEPTSPTSLHRYGGPPLLIRIFNTPKLRLDYDADDRWKAPTTREEHTLSQGVYAYVDALLHSPHLTDPQATDVLCTTFHSVGRDERTKEIKRKDFNAMNFAMQQGHLSAAGFMLMAIGDSRRSLATKARIVDSLGLDRELYSERLTTLKQMPRPVPPNKDPYRWVRELSPWSAKFLSACDLMKEDGRVQLSTDDPAHQLSRDGDLRAIDFESASKDRPAAVICSSRFALPHLSIFEVETDKPQADGTRLPVDSTRLYAIPVSALERRHDHKVQANL